MSAADLAASEPPAVCGLCPRLASFRQDNRATHPDWHNAPVPAFGNGDARLLIVGLAPGLSGANRTGRPFTGDFAGDLLYPALLRQGFAEGRFGRAADDGLRLRRCRVTNAVRCVPPANKPTGAEARTCRQFLAREMAGLPELRAVLALGRVAHDQVLAACELRRARHPFKHGAQHPLPGGRRLFDSYHCSRYNTNTGVLTEAMFDAVIADIAAYLEAAPALKTA